MFDMQTMLIHSDKNCIFFFSSDTGSVKTGVGDLDQE